MHFPGLLGMPRRIYTYPADRGWDILNLVTTLGVPLQALAVLIFLVNVVYSLRRGAPAGGNPWEAWTLEWATTSPPPAYNFATLPPVNSRRPLSDLQHPDDPDGSDEWRRLLRTRGRHRLHRGRHVARRRVRGRLPLLYRQESVGFVSEGSPGAADSRHDLPTVQQRDGRAGKSRARRRLDSASRRVAVRHCGARRGVPRQHGAGVASAHHRPRLHHRDESARHNVLPARGAPRLAGDARARHAQPLHHLRVLGRTQGRPCGTRRARLLVLALRGRRVGRGLHRRVRGGAMIKPAVEVVIAAVPRDRSQLARDLVALGKPRVLVMVLASTLAGYFAALDGPPDLAQVIHLLIGTLMAAGGTLALNQYVERDVDALMERTRRRPLPDGRLQPLEALLFAGVLTSAGVTYLAASVGMAVAGLTLATTILYLGAYTPLKTRSALCMLVGAVPGALPPVTGWLAARGELGLGATMLFAIVFLWQLPHTLAIARLYRDDYARAGVRVLPVVDAHGTASDRQIVTSTLALFGVSVLPAAIGLGGTAYFATACVLGLGLLGAGLTHARRPSVASARRVLMATLLYLPLLFSILVLDRP